MKKLSAVLAGAALMVGMVVSLAGATSFTVSGSDTPSAYTLISPVGTLSQPVIAALPAGPWVQGTWLAPQIDQAWPMTPTSGNLPGTYNYTTNFDLNGLDPLTAILSGSWATDNSGVLYLNGNKVSTSGSFSEATLFSITDGFISNINLLEFKVTNDPYPSVSGFNPTGLFVKFTAATAAPVPEPGTMVLLGAGLLGLVVYGKRRTNNKEA